MNKAQIDAPDILIDIPEFTPDVLPDVQDTPSSSETDTSPREEQTPQWSKVSWEHSLRATMIYGLISAIIFFSLLIVYIVTIRSKTQIMAEADLLAGQLGFNMINNIDNDLHQITSLARDMAKSVQTTPKTPEYFQRVFANKVNVKENDMIAGWGVWLAPNTFSTDQKKQSFYWRKNSAGLRESVLDYNFDLDYLDKSWYINSELAPANQCVWEKVYQSYIGAFAHVPSVMCSMRIEEDGFFHGAATVELSLPYLEKLLRSWDKHTGGYAFITDAHNRILSFPDAPKTSQSIPDTFGQDAVHLPDMLDIVNTRPELQPILDAFKQYNDDAIYTVKSRRLDTFINTRMALHEKKPSLDDFTVSLQAIALLDSDGSIFDSYSDTPFATLSIRKDKRLRGEARAYLFHMPMTQWKLALVLPTERSFAFANRLSRDLLMFIILALICISMLVYVSLYYSMLSPLEKMSTALQKVRHILSHKQHDKLRSFQLSSMQANEVGLVSESINQLIRHIVAYQHEITEANILLEEKVRERTQKLSDTLSSLAESQAELIESEKMALLGQMVAGVAHEVNTPLCYVKSNLLVTEELINKHSLIIEKNNELGEMLNTKDITDPALLATLQDTIAIAKDLKEQDFQGEMQEVLQDSLFGIDQISELVVNLKDFTRLDEAKIQDIDIEDCIKTSLKIAKPHIKHIEIKKSFTTLPKVVCSPSQINQVLLNLITNAAQAIQKEHGIISLRTFSEGSYVGVSIEDNGTGMTKDTIDNAFQPFFTTKPAGEGTGLGLAICDKIIEQHQGEIKVTSEVGIGTTVQVLLPVESANSLTTEALEQIYEAYNIDYR